MSEALVRSTHPPLAEAMRPRSLEEVVGQNHLLGPHKPLRLSLEGGVPHSMILWGPPGVGKTTLAQLMARSFNAEFIAISAVLSGVKDIRDAVARAQEVQATSGRQTILFVDEVHRFNKAQQDAFLPFVEQGLLTFIGATTENPSFEVISALLSRTVVYVLKALSPDELAILLTRASERLGLHLTKEAQERVILFSDGDARRLFNVAECLALAARPVTDVAVSATQDVAWVEAVLAQDLRRFDKQGDAFYDQISALHKSVRGSNPDASLYWMTRMLDGGTDPLYLGRRMVRMAVEDIGLADPRALTMALQACETYERLGSPEGELALASAIIYLACAPKSNAAYVAFNAAQAHVRHDGSRPVPMHLRNAPTRLMKELGHGKDYHYAHHAPDAYIAGENYFPEGMDPPHWYQPTDRGLEGQIKDKLARLADLDAKASAHKK